MSRALCVLWIGAAAVSFGSIGLTGHQFTLARAQARSDLSRLSMISPQVREIAALRAAAPAWAGRMQPETTLAPAAAAAVAACGLATSALANVAPQAAARVGEGQFAAVRQRATITLSAVTLPEVGRFLEAWRSAEPDWVVVSLELAPQARPTVTAGGDLPLRAVIVVEALFMHESPGSSGRRTGGKP